MWLSRTTGDKLHTVEDKRSCFPSLLRWESTRRWDCPDYLKEHLEINSSILCNSQLLESRLHPCTGWEGSFFGLLPLNNWPEVLLNTIQFSSRRQQQGSQCMLTDDFFFFLFFFFDGWLFSTSFGVVLPELNGYWSLRERIWCSIVKPKSPANNVLQIYYSSVILEGKRE